MTKHNPKIPDGWCVKKLGEIASFKSGGTPKKDCVRYWNGDIPWISASSMRGLYYSDSSEKITQNGLDEGSNYVTKGDLLLLVRGSMLWNCIPVGMAMKKIAFNQDVKGIVLSKNVMSKYLLCWFYANENEIKHMVVGTGIGAGKLDTDNLKNLNIFYPPLPEQEKIADILGCWDNAIVKLTALINAKKQRKKGLMQKLLTAKIRLPGFTDNWETVKLGDVCVKIKDKNKKSISFVATISGQHGFVRQEHFFNKLISSNNLQGYFLLKNGDFGYNRSYSKGYPMGAIKRLKKFKEAIVSTLYICFRPLKQKISSIFLEHYFESGLFNKELYKIVQEGARNHGLLNVSLEDFYISKLNLPTSLPEQQAIADVLSKADEEINLLNQKLALFQEQKKALMQQLLTGSIRVKVA